MSSSRSIVKADIDVCDRLSKGNVCFDSEAGTYWNGIKRVSSSRVKGRNRGVAETSMDRGDYRWKYVDSTC